MTKRTPADIIAQTPPSVDRRDLLRGTGAGALAFGALATAGLAATSSPANAQGVSDADIANFALNLEYLEAEYYIRAATGLGLAAADQTGLGSQGTVTGGRKVNFATPLIQQYAMEIAQDELAHVRFLRAVLGANAVAEPTIDIVNSFNTLAQVAGIGPSFDPYADENSFLIGAFIFEDVGVTAYHGAAPLVQNKTVLSAAAGILAVEAYRASLSGAADDQGVTDAAGNANIVPTDANSIVFSRTTRQVLNIVYGAPNAAGGLFFPTGVNGAIR